MLMPPLRLLLMMPHTIRQRRYYASYYYYATPLIATYCRCFTATIDDYATLPD